MTEDERSIIQEKTRRVVCAANKTKEGAVLVGARHWDNWMRDTANRLGIRGGDEKQGFIDQYGNFLTRSEAWKVAKRQNQIIRLCGGQSIYDEEGTLWSENLY